jgi:spermidine/putrescine transport system substrate-binding protein
METELTILIWPDYINLLTLSQFEAEFGVKVTLEIVPSAVELVARMHEPGPPPDVLVPPDYAVRELSADGLLMSLNPSLLPNRYHLQPQFLNGRSHDPESQVSIIKDWGTTGFMVRTDMVNEQLTSWADFWELASHYSGQVTVLDSPSEVIGAALKMCGHSYNAADIPALNIVRDDLLKLKPHLHSFETNYKPLLESGEACMALGWNGDAVALKARGLPIHYVLPVEGSQLWEDDWSIAANAPHPEAAHAFLNFVMRPEVAAQEALYTRYATGNRTALALLDEESRNDPFTYPSADLFEKLEAGMPLDTAGTSARAALWDEIRNNPPRHT